MKHFVSGGMKLMVKSLKKLKGGGEFSLEDEKLHRVLEVALSYQQAA
ncbi:MAG: hypothetical protein ACUVTF_06580 [bacterium]